MWASKRLAQMTDTTALEDLAIALFCYQQDSSYLFVGHARPRILHANRADRFQATEIYLRYLIFYDVWKNSGNWPVLPNFSMVAKAINLTRYHMGPKQRAIFDPWVEGIINRMNVLAPLPEHARLTWDIPQSDEPSQRLLVMGVPVPPQVLNLHLDLGGLDMFAASREFLTTVDWQNNRYLKPPEDIVLASGGRPYQDPR